MITIVCFFVGLLLVILGEDISKLTNIIYISLGFNIVGCICMGYSTFVFLMKKDEENQCKKGILENTNQLYKEISEKIECQNEIIKGVSECQNKCNNSIEELCTMIKDYVIFFKENSPSNEEIKKLESIIEINKNNILESLNGLIEIPSNLGDEIERLIDSMSQSTNNIITKVEYLTEDLEEQDEKRMKNFNRMLNELKDYSVDNNEEIVEQLKVLGQQYLEFEKVADSIVQKITFMAENDIEVMKGFLNG